MASTLPTTGTDPKVATKSDLEEMVDTAVSQFAATLGTLAEQDTVADADITGPVEFSKLPEVNASRLMGRGPGAGVGPIEPLGVADVQEMLNLGALAQKSAVENDDITGPVEFGKLPEVNASRLMGRGTGAGVGPIEPLGVADVQEMLGVADKAPLNSPEFTGDVLVNGVDLLALILRTAEFTAETYSPAPFSIQDYLVTTSPVDGLSVDMMVTEPSGTIFLAVYATGAPEPSWSQIIAGVDGAGEDAVYFTSVAVFAIGTAFDMDFMPTPGVSYEVYAFQRSATGLASRRVKQTVVEPLPLFSGAIDGVPGTIVGRTGAVITPNYLGPSGANTAVLVSDNDDGGSTVDFFLLQSNTLPAKNLRVEVLFKKIGGDFDGLRIRFGNFTGGPLLFFHLADLDIDSDTFDATTITATGNGWISVTAEVDASAWSDLTGIIYAELMLGSTPSALLRNGQQQLAVQSFRIY